VPLGFPYLLLENTTLAIGFMFFVTMMINTYLGPSLAISHALVPPAILLFYLAGRSLPADLAREVSL
jgi:hypothetical protein